MAEPTFLAEIPAGTDLSVYHVGLTLLGETETLQGRLVAGVMEARCSAGTPLYTTTVVMMGRRATKTTSIWAVLLGRCSTIPGYRVAVTAQDGTRSGQRIREVMRGLEARGFEESGQGVLEWSNGREAIRFENGSRLWTVKPVAAAFRSEAADALLFDEAGELDPDKSADLQAGALPLLDTRPMGQAIIAGTPAPGRSGLLWETLEEARAQLASDEERDPEERVGIVDYSIRDDEEAVVLDEAGEVTGLNEDVLQRVHPGLDPVPATGRPLTPMAVLRSRFKKLGRTRFEMEYLCRFPSDSATDAISPETWAALGVEPFERPEHVGMAFDCSYDGSAASVVYAWRTEDGRPVVELVAHRLGTNWLPGAVHKVLKERKRTTVAHDDIGANRDPATALSRMKPAPRMDRLQTKDIMGAASRFANEVHAGSLVHFGQSDMDAAIGNLTWRDIGKSGRAFGTKSYAGPPISPVVAASLALWSYDRLPKRTRLTIAT